MKELVKTHLYGIIRKLTPDFKGDISVKIPENKEHGDYTANAAFLLGKFLKKSPQEIAENLVAELKKQNVLDFSKIENKNGFINFFLSPEYLFRQLEEILSAKGGSAFGGKNKYGFSKNGGGRKIQVEFISANPTGPLTIGNGRGGFYGDALANVLETQGNKVAREYYINDRGEQVLNLGRSIKSAQSDMRHATCDMEENLYRGEYVNELAEKIDKKLNVGEAGQKAVELILKTYIKPAIKRLGIKFDVWFSEKTLYADKRQAASGKRQGIYEEVMGELIDGRFVYEKDGATWMKTSSLGDSEDRVLIKKDGSETYFLSDILYHFDKFKIRKFDKAIDIWGADHHGYAPRLLAALKALGIPEDNLEIIITQLVRLVKGGESFKISKRAGTFVTLEELVNEVGLDAARFFFLMYSPNTHMDFDIALAKERSQKNPVYYVQYAHARISGILRQATSDKRHAANIEILKEKSELDLIRKLVEYPELLAEIAENYEVHRLPRYALDLAREFHNFYEKERVITEDKNLTSARLALVLSAKIVLANVLSLMGIKAPDKM
ncbi:arginine--tRNA ligase [Candidatus Azambacteria bacterium]|nr:arginine--tRNA ligase [Candidatus Azambacteria bacterium]